MQNTINLEDSSSNKVTFDLKGSTANRTVNLSTEESKFWRRSGPINQKQVLKDLNFLEIQKDTGKPLIELNVVERNKIKKQLQADTLFLLKHNIMDYSFLISIESPNCI